MIKIDFSRSALLLVDMQMGLWHGPEPVHACAQVLAHVQSLVRLAHEHALPIFAARHTGPAGSPIAVGAPAWSLLPDLGLTEQDQVFDKTRPNCFWQTPLAEALAARAIQTLLIAGLKTQYCIDSTCRAAAEHGVQALLISDAHSCMDTPLLSAADIIAHHNHTLAAFAQLCSTAELLAAAGKTA